MTYGFVDVLSLVGSLGFFIYGMKIMSEGIQKVAGNRLRQILGAMTTNKFAGVFTGFLLTTLVQSSSATTVMVVSFVNAGLLSLPQSIGVIMGANIGTTVTAWIVSTIGFKVKIATAALPIIAVAFPMLFTSKGKIKALGEALIGFALLFMGLQLLQESMPDLKSNPQVLQFLADYTNSWWSVFLFVLIGTVMTLILQSSSATMTLTLVMANEGWIPFDMAAAMVLGENIGTTVTANLAALIANVHAKRAARAHFIFNIFGVLWMLILFPFFLKGIDAYMLSGEGVSPFVETAAIPIALSIFHTAFNIINVLLLVWFTNQIARLVIKFVPSTGEDDEFKLEYISSALSTPELSIHEAGREIAKFGKITAKMSLMIQALLGELPAKKRGKLMRKVVNYEEITDRVEVEISNFLSKVSTANLSGESSLRLRNMLSISNDLERIGDLFFQMSLAVERAEAPEIKLNERQKDNIQSMLNLLDEAFGVMNENLHNDYNRVSIDDAVRVEKDINQKRDKLRKKYFKHIEKRDFDVKSGSIYAELFTIAERIGDHVMNVTEAITGEVARDEEDLEEEITS